MLEGWYKESTFVTKWNFTTDTVAGAMTLYAKWLCACPEPRHLDFGETCNCGGADCACTDEYPVPADWEDTPLAGIKIYKQGDISTDTLTAEEVMAARLANVKNVYDGYDPIQQPRFLAGIDKVVITDVEGSGAGTSWVEDSILFVGKETNSIRIRSAINASGILN